MRGRDARGFALVAAIVALVVVGALAAAGHLLSVQAYRFGRATLEAGGALYAAELGLAEAVAAWPDSAARALRPGETAVVRDGPLPNGDAVRVVLERIDDGSHPALERYLVHSFGRPRALTGAARHLAFALELRWPAIACCAAAVNVRAEGVISGAAAVVSEGVGMRCGFPGSSPGVARSPEGSIALSPDPGAVRGDPPLVTDSTLLPPIGGDPPFDEWARRATLRFAGGERLTGIGPRQRADGSCDVGDRLNWGEPADPGHPCARHFPVIYAQGDLELLGPGRGQGVLLVDGDLTLRGGFVFHGLVLVRGSADLGPEGDRLEGTLLAERARIAAGPSGPAVRYAPCRIREALVGGRLVGPRPLPDRPWVELSR